MSDEKDNVVSGGEAPESNPKSTHETNKDVSAEPVQVDPVTWEREVITQIALASLKEQKTNRRWNIFFKAMYMMMLLYMIYIMYVIASVSYAVYEPLISGGANKQSKGHTALIELGTQISADSESSADNLISGLRAAIKDKNTRGIIIRANSPGGSPVESAYVYDEIFRLRKKRPDIKIYTVIKDGCFSGCYYIAAASNEIYANRSSLVGSIGVIHTSFGFPGLMKKLGIESRIIATSENKAFLSPFKKLNPKHIVHMKKILSETHEVFKADVIKGRQGRLKVDTKDLFSGLVWNAKRAKEIGLIDDFGSSSYVARTIIGAEKIKDFTPKKSFWKSVLGGVNSEIKQKLINNIHPWKVMAQ